MDNQLTSTSPQPAPALPAPQADQNQNPDQSQNRAASAPDQPGADGSKRVLIYVIIAVVVVLALIGAAIWGLTRPTTDTAKIRDVFIIFMAMQSLLTGLSLIVLIVQLARLINLLQNEIKPILDTTNDTVNNLRGTTVFLSDNLVEPVIKLNEYLAGFSQLVQVLGLARKPRHK